MENIKINSKQIIDSFCLIKYKLVINCLKKILSSYNYNNNYIDYKIEEMQQVDNSLNILKLDSENKNCDDRTNENINCESNNKFKNFVKENENSDLNVNYLFYGYPKINLLNIIISNILSCLENENFIFTFFTLKGFSV